MSTRSDSMERSGEKIRMDLEYPSSKQLAPKEVLNSAFRLGGTYPPPDIMDTDAISLTRPVIGANEVDELRSLDEGRSNSLGSSIPSMERSEGMTGDEGEQPTDDFTLAKFGHAVEKGRRAIKDQGKWNKDNGETCKQCGSPENCVLDPKFARCTTCKNNHVSGCSRFVSFLRNFVEVTTGFDSTSFDVMYPDYLGQQHEKKAATRRKSHVGGQVTTDLDKDIKKLRGRPRKNTGVPGILKAGLKKRRGRPPGGGRKMGTNTNEYNANVQDPTGDPSIVNITTDSERRLAEQNQTLQDTIHDLQVRLAEVPRAPEDPDIAEGTSRRTSSRREAAETYELRKELMRLKHRFNEYLRIHVIDLDERAILIARLSVLLPYLDIALGLFDRDKVDLWTIRRVVNQARFEVRSIVEAEFMDRLQLPDHGRIMAPYNRILPIGNRSALPAEFVEGSSGDGLAQSQFNIEETNYTESRKRKRTSAEVEEEFDNDSSPETGRQGRSGKSNGKRAMKYRGNGA